MKAHTAKPLIHCHWARMQCLRNSPFHTSHITQWVSTNLFPTSVSLTVFIIIMTHLCTYIRIPSLALLLPCNHLTLKPKRGGREHEVTNLSSFFLSSSLKCDTTSQNCWIQMCSAVKLPAEGRRYCIKLFLLLVSPLKISKEGFILVTFNLCITKSRNFRFFVNTSNTVMMWCGKSCIFHWLQHVTVCDTHTHSSVHTHIHTDTPGCTQVGTYLSSVCWPWGPPHWWLPLPLRWGPESPSHQTAGTTAVELHWPHPQWRRGTEGLSAGGGAYSSTLIS